ncbi:hypothetical protein MHU86_2322 [Fragilaria crotonensis]|nr:hypothetical protein MHU86_2322 [Fragilaria crotonensis]
MSSSPRPEPFDNSLVFPGESGELDDDHVQLLLRSLNTTTHGTPAEQSLGSFTRRKLRRLQIGRNGRTLNSNNLTRWQSKRCMEPLSLLRKTQSSFASIGIMLSKGTAPERHEIAAMALLVQPRS